MPATATKRQSKSKPVRKPSKPSKAKAAVKPSKPAKPAKQERRTEAEQEASDNKFYGTLEKHGISTNNSRSGKRLGRFVLQAHCLAQCWPSKPQTAAQIAEACSAKFGIRITVARVERQLIDELRCGRVVAKGKGYVRTDVTANRWSLATE